MVTLHLRRVTAYQALGDLEEAEAAVFLAMMTDQANPWVHKAMGDLLRARGSLPAAQKAYEGALKLAPDLYFGLGIALWEQGKRTEAQEKFSRYLELAPYGQQAEEAREYLAP